MWGEYNQSLGRKGLKGTKKTKKRTDKAPDQFIASLRHIRTDTLCFPLDAAAL